MANHKKILPKKPIFLRLIKIVLGIVFILGISLLVLRYWGAANRDIIFNEIAYQNSEDYHFSQNSLTRWVTITKQGKKLYHFYFYPQVFAAWVDKNRPYVFLVTSDTGTLKGAQGLYVYDGKQVIKIYQARNIEFADGKTSPGRIYIPWFSPSMRQNEFEEELKKVKIRMNDVFFLSPDGRYLFGYESGYEGGSGFTIDLHTMKKTLLQLDVFGRLRWSPDKKCAVNFAYEYGDQARLQLVLYQKGTLISKTIDQYFVSSSLIDAYWGEACDGVVAIFSDYDAQGNEHRQTTLYKFSSDKESLTPISTTLTELQDLETIILKPKYHHSIR